MPSEQSILPGIPGPALVVGPVFLCFEVQAVKRTPEKDAMPIVPFWKRHQYRIAGQKWGSQFIQEYMDSECRAWKDLIKQHAALQMLGRAPSWRPIALLVHAFKPVPTSWTGKSKALALIDGIGATTKPDGDNHLKIVCDALNKVAWNDDAQITDMRCIKRYSDAPALRIEVREFVQP